MKVDPGLAARLTDQEQRFGAPGWQPLDVVCSRGDGAYLWDVQGTRYLDFHAADGTVNQGHSHTRIAAAMVEQCLRLPLPSRHFRHDRLPPLLERLCTLTGFEGALLVSTAEEAVASALRAAALWGTRMKGHPGEVLRFQGPGAGPDALPYGDLAAVREAVGPRTSALLVEPIQGAEVRLPPRGFLKGLRELCDTRGLLLLVDEVTCGLGRTGKLMAFEHEGIRPDGAILGKALSGGFYPVSAFLASRRLLDLGPAGPHATFEGNPLACAVVSAALDVLVEDRLADRAAELGAYFLARLRSLEGRIREIRGLGLWAAIQVEGRVRPLREALAREGLLCGEAEGALILSPPLVITREQLDWALERLERALAG